MNKVSLIFSSDYELFGDGSGDVNREQIIPINDMINLFSKYGAKLTIMFEYGQYRAYKKFAKYNPELLEDNIKIEKQLIDAIKRGHDVQLHYHGQWHNAKYSLRENKFYLDLSNVDITTLNELEIDNILSEGKKFLEELLKVYNQEYKCESFRAGSWSVKNEKKLLKALQKNGFKLDTSVVPNSAYKSAHVSYSYHDSPHEYNYWHCDKYISKNSNIGKIIELPIFTIKSNLAMLKYLNIKYFDSKKKVNEVYRTNISTKNTSRYDKILRVLKKNTYMADLNNITSKNLIKMVDIVINNKNITRKITPLMFISHSKNNNDLEELDAFLQYAKDNENISFITLQETIEYIYNNENLAIKIDIMKNLNAIDKDIFIPVFAKKNYLKAKSNEYGWFKSDLFIIPFYNDKKLIFSKIVFTTDAIPITKRFNHADKVLFLDKVVEYITEYKLCDFISKAQSNVIFTACPKSCICVPWGTYEIELGKTNEELLNSFNAKSRNIIRKAIKNNVLVQDSNDIHLVYENIKEMFVRQCMINYPSESYIEKVSKMKDSGKLFIAIKDNRIQGSLILLYDKQRAYAMYAGSVKSPMSGSLDLLHYEAMKFAIKNEIPFYDFVGTRINIKQNSKQEGINRFKKKFNPHLKEGYAFRKIIKPFKYFLYLISLKIYLILKGKIYKDPISEIIEDQHTKESMLKRQEILIIGPGATKSESGGVVSVIENLIKNLDEKYKVTRIITMRPVDVFYRLGLYINSFYAVIKSKLNNNNKIAHIHTASRVSFYRKSLIALVLKVLHIPFILHIHGASFHIFFSKESSMIQQKYIKWIFGLADRVILLSHSWNKWYINTIYEKNSSVVYNGVENYYDKASIPIAQRDNIVLFLGRLGKRKGIYDLLHAFKKVLTIIPNAELKIGGDGEVKLCKDLAKELNIFSNISFLGWVGEEEKRKLFNEAKIYILPSYNEGLPMGVLEAMSAGIGVITTPVGGIPEAIENNKNGILVKEGSVEEISKAITSLLSDNNKITTLGLEAKKTYHEKFDIEKVAAQVEEIYDELYGRKRHDI